MKAYRATADASLTYRDSTASAPMTVDRTSVDGNLADEARDSIFLSDVRLLNNVTLIIPEQDDGQTLEVFVPVVTTSGEIIG